MNLNNMTIEFLDFMVSNYVLINHFASDFNARLSFVCCFVTAIVVLVNGLGTKIRLKGRKYLKKFYNYIGYLQQKFLWFTLHFQKCRGLTQSGWK